MQDAEPPFSELIGLTSGEKRTSGAGPGFSEFAPEF